MDRERLATVLGMMGSAHDGEALNAARLAVRMLKEAKATWPEVLRRAGRRRSGPRPPRRERTATASKPRTARRAGAIAPSAAADELGIPGEQIAQTVEWTAILTDWERAFVTDMSERWRAPSEKQQAILDRISTKIAGIARARGLRP